MFYKYQKPFSSHNYINKGFSPTQSVKKEIKMCNFESLILDLMNASNEEVKGIYKQFREELPQHIGAAEARTLIQLSPNCSKRSEWEDNPHLEGARLFGLMRDVLGRTQNWDFLRTIIGEADYKHRYLVRGIVAGRRKLKGSKSASDELSTVLLGWALQQLDTMQKNDTWSSNQMSMCLRLIFQFGQKSEMKFLERFENFLSAHIYCNSHTATTAINAIGEFKKKLLK